MTYCSKCKTEKDGTSFPKNKARKNGLNAHCRACVKIYSDAHKASRGVAIKIRNKRNSLIRKYGITFETYMEMLEGQDFLCSICRTRPSDKNWFCVDHDHKTGKIRGILCMKCNAGIGQFGDSRERLLRAAIYLEAHGG